ncbi:MAG: dihydrofolate reductase family protein [Anaerolineae bacterium]
MGTIGAGFSMSLDGFIAGPNDDVSRLFAWMFAGTVDVQRSSGDTDFELKVSEESAEHVQQQGHGMGAIVSGRRMFDVAGAWGGKHPLDVPVIVVTHSIPQEWANKKDSPFIFVTDGVESAIRKAREIAGDKGIGIGGANLTQQCLKLGLLDEIGVDLVPVLLGSGVRLFEQLGIEPVELECTRALPAPGVTHLSFRVLK